MSIDRAWYVVLLESTSDPISVDEEHQKSITTGTLEREYRSGEQTIAHQHYIIPVGYHQAEQA